MINGRKSKQTICAAIKSSWHSIARLYNIQAANYGLTASIGFVLLNIDVEKGTPATKVGPLMGTESRSLTRMLKGMEEKGLIYKQQNKEDKRQVKIFLTEKGIEKREVAKEVVKKFNQVVKNNVPQEELIIFFRVIDKISEIIDTKNIYTSENLLIDEQKN